MKNKIPDNIVVCCNTCANDTLENHCVNRDTGPCKNCYYKNWTPKDGEKKDEDSC